MSYDKNITGIFIEVNPKNCSISGVRLCATDESEARAVVKALSRITTRAAWLWLRGLFLGDAAVIKRQPRQEDDNR